MFATSPDQLATRADVLSMTGLAFMEGILAGRFPLPPISGVMDYSLTAVAPGRVVFTGTPAFSHCNPLGTVHGGWYGTLLDSAMTCAVHTTVPQGKVCTTLEYKVNVVRAIPLETVVQAVGEVDHAGRTTGVARGEIRGVTDGRLFATGSTTCMILDG